MYGTITISQFGIFQSVAACILACKSNFAVVYTPSYKMGSLSEGLPYKKSFRNTRLYRTHAFGL